MCMCGRAGMHMCVCVCVCVCVAEKSYFRGKTVHGKYFSVRAEEVEN